MDPNTLARKSSRIGRCPPLCPIWERSEPYSNEKHAVWVRKEIILDSLKAQLIYRWITNELYDSLVIDFKSKKESVMSELEFHERADLIF